jgi:Ferritin-like domain
MQHDNPTRRRVLAAAVTGSVLGLIGVRSAAASQATTTTTGTETTTSGSGAPTTAATTTTLPPRQPTPTDIPVLQYAESIELAARDLYTAAIAAGVKNDVISALQSNHRGYADVVRGMLGVNSVGVPNAGLHSSFADRFNLTDAPALARPAYELESTLVATHIESLRKLKGTDPARRIASILIVEARHCAVLADISGRSKDFDALFENVAHALTPPAEG